MKYTFARRVKSRSQFYYGCEGFVIKYQYEPHNLLEQQHKYLVRFFIDNRDVNPIDVWFWENELYE